MQKERILWMDIGNTNTKYSFEDLPSKVINNDILFNSDISIWQDYNLNYNKIVFSSSLVVDDIKGLLKSIFSKKVSLKDIIEIKSQKAFNNNLFNCYDSYNSLGSDRWINMIGARKIFNNKDLVIISSGTCVVVDFINKSGKHLGGIIAPALNKDWNNMPKNLYSKFSKYLNISNFKDSPTKLGNNTQKCVALGLLAIKNNLILYISDKINNIFSNSIVILTGGNIDKFKQIEKKHKIFLEPDLALIGIKNYYYMD